MENSLTNLPAKNSLAEVIRLPALPKSFYLRDTCTVARDLLGKGLVLRLGKDWLALELVEVEAYLGNRDPASHAYRGETPRNRAMFDEGGTCYVYLSYGINHCMNVSTGPKGVGEAVLLRAGRPLFGKEVMRSLRKMPDGELSLTNGPGKLTQAMGIGPRNNGRGFNEKDFKLVDLGNNLKPRDIGKSPRVGISKATELHYRFFIKNSAWLSRKGPIVYEKAV